MELAEPRMRTGVWERTTFRVDPIRRLRRTGLAALVTIYGARSTAETMIARVRHGIAGTTPSGQAYRANDPELLNWVQGTAAYGFLQAYHVYVQPLSLSERDRSTQAGHKHRGHRNQDCSHPIAISISPEPAIAARNRRRIRALRLQPGELMHGSNEPSGRPPSGAVLDRRCARRPHHCAGRDGRMAPPGAEQKNGTEQESKMPSDQIP